MFIINYGKMKTLFCTIFIILSTILFYLVTFSSCQKEQFENYILIYNGSISDADGVAKITQMVEEKDYKPEYISNLDKLPEMLENAKAFIIGGTIGDTGDLLEEIDDSKGELKKFIENGGKYLGICGGAYVASKGSKWSDGYETGMGLVDIESFAYDSIYADPQIISISWLDTQRTIYYQYGPAFIKNSIPTESKVFAYYNNKNNDVAIFATPIGKGKILLCGPHPEADATWLEDNPEPLHANTWKNTHDIFSYIFDDLMSD
jgi:glutamine amidotransferase-like uncharacterized protein